MGYIQLPSTFFACLLVFRFDVLGLKRGPTTKIDANLVETCPRYLGWKKKVACML